MLDKVNFKGQSGREYSFRVYVWENKFKPLSAVYVVTERVAEPDAAPSYTPVFVGSTDDISQIFGNHEKSECFQMYYANTIAVLPVSDASVRTQVEQDLIKGLDPPCNAASSF